MLADPGPTRRGPTFDPTRGSPMTDRLPCVARLPLAMGLAVMPMACSPSVGSEAWREDMNAKPKGDWTANEAADDAEHCLFR
jgi:hypothetical protein